MQSETQITEQLIQDLDKQLRIDRQHCASSHVSYHLQLVYLKHAWKRWLFPALVASLIIGSIAAYLTISWQAQMTVMTHLRLATVSTVLPLAEWLGVPKDLCLFPNPFHIPPFILKPEDCEKCESLDRIIRIRAGPYGQADFQRDLIDTQQAALLDPQATGSPGLFASAGNASLDQLAAFYAALPDALLPPDGEPVATEEGACDVRHSLMHSRPDLYSPRRLLRAAAGSSGLPGGWAASWRHCSAETARAFRRFLARPACLPMSASLTQNHVLLWDAYPGHRPLLLPIRPMSEFLLLYQVNGTAKIELTPREPCHGHCPSLHTVIRPGQLMSISNRFYFVRWLPMSMKAGFAVAVEVKTDLSY